MFAESGLDAPLDRIARRAGLGSGTLYRHFPSRDDLITAVFEDRMAENLAALARAQQTADPWYGFSQYVLETSRAQASGRGIADLLAISYGRPELVAWRRRALRVFNVLVARAKGSGALRQDFVPQDMVLLQMAIAGIVARAGTLAPVAVERFVTITLDGWRAEASSPAPPPVPRGNLVAQLRRLSGASSSEATSR